MSKAETFTAEALREVLEYDPVTGRFTWKDRPDDDFKTKRAAAIFRAKRRGREAFTYTGFGGYRETSLQGVGLLAHRVAVLLMTGSWPPQQVDHINGDRTDNRWCNLRLADQTTNNRNMAMPKSNTSGRVGVCYDKERGKWYAQGRSCKRQFNLGRFETMDEAVAARAKFEREYGFHPNHGRKVA